MIKQLLNSVITKYHDLSVSCRSIICLSLRLQQIIYLLATDKSRYFAQPRPIIVNSSAIADNMTQKGHRIKWDYFDILAPGHSDIYCKIKETLMIPDLKPDRKSVV